MHDYRQLFSLLFSISIVCFLNEKNMRMKIYIFKFIIKHFPFYSITQNVYRRTIFTLHTIYIMHSKTYTYSMRGYRDIFIFKSMCDVAGK